MVAIAHNIYNLCILLPDIRPDTEYKKCRISGWLVIRYNPSLYLWSVGICRLPMLVIHTLATSMFRQKPSMLSFSRLFLLVQAQDPLASWSSNYVCSIGALANLDVLTVMTVLLFADKQLKPVSRTQVNLETKIAPDF